MRTPRSPALLPGAGVLAADLFATLGHIAPRNLPALALIVLAAVAIASVIFAIMEMDTPFTGLITVSIAPMRDALAHLSEQGGCAAWGLTKLRAEATGAGFSNAGISRPSCGGGPTIVANGTGAGSRSHRG
jgi:hypothetical protein